jgi:hypothetical protein
MAEKVVNKDSIPKAGERKVEIRTAEDATFAFLRNEIDEDTFREYMGYFGVLPGQLLRTPTNLERPDSAFENKIPDDVFVPEPEANPDLDERLKAANEKEKVRDEATKTSVKELGDVQRVEAVPAGTVAAEQEREAQEKQAKQEVKDTKAETKTPAGSKDK